MQEQEGGGDRGQWRPRWELCGMRRGQPSWGQQDTEEGFCFFPRREGGHPCLGMWT